MTSRHDDLKGRVFGRLTVLSSYSDSYKNVIWVSKCVCGGVNRTSRSHLEKGRVKSCGCWMKQVVGDTHRTHGESRTRVYKTWMLMRQRCENSKNKDYARYGGRGITVCSRWKRFENFRDDMGPIPSGYASIERRNNNKNYEPSNCFWATNPKVQARNRRSNRRLSYKGKELLETEWAEFLGIKKSTLCNRLNILGWSIEKALTTPVRGRK